MPKPFDRRIQAKWRENEEKALAYAVRNRLDFAESVPLPFERRVLELWLEHEWQALAHAVRHKLGLPDSVPLPSSQAVADALDEPWMKAAGDTFAGRIGALFILHGKVDRRVAEELTLSTALLLAGTVAYASGLTARDPLADLQAQRFTGPHAGFAAKVMLDVIENFLAAHLIWQYTEPEEVQRLGIRHPLAALIEGFMTRPVPATKNDKATALIIKEHFRIQGLASPPAELQPVDVGQAMLPGIEALLPDYDEMEVFPALAMFDALRGSDKEAGLGLRTLVTVLTEIDVQASTPLGERGVLVPMTMRSLTKHLWPRGKFHRRNMPRLRAAMFGWQTTGIPERGGLRRVIGTIGEWIALPDDYPLDGEIKFQVYLPPDAKQGALVHRETLDYLGASSGLMYRAALTLAHQWWRAAHSKKDKNGVTLGTTWPYATRPVRLTDKEGQLIVRKGRTVPGDPSGEREPNPMTQYLPSFNDERVLRLCYAPTQIAAANLTGNLHKYRARAWATVTKMDELGLLDKSEYFGGVKLCPPRGWGVNFKMPEAVKMVGRWQKKKTQQAAS